MHCQPLSGQHGRLTLPFHLWQEFADFLKQVDADAAEAAAQKAAEDAAEAVDKQDREEFEHM